jgi:hypothetical protein
MVYLSFVLGSVDAKVHVQSMSSYCVTGCFHQLLTNQKPLSLWMFWIIMELMP